MSAKLKDVAIEVAKMTIGVVAGRTAAVMGENALKVNEELDPKKKKMKEVGIGLGITAVGAFGATKVPKAYQSILGGVAVGGAVSAMSPFGKPNKGFIPVLNGMEGDTEDFQLVNSLQAPDDLDRYLNNEIDKEIEIEIDDEIKINSLASTEYQEVQTGDYSMIN